MSDDPSGTTDSATDAEGVESVTPSSESEPSPDGGSTKGGAGRGVVAIAGAKVWFIVTSYAVALLLPRLLGLEAFGVFVMAISSVSMLNNVLVVATVQSVSKFVSEDEDNAPSRLREALRIQTVVGAVLALSLFLLASVIAEEVLLDPKLTPLLQITSVVVFAYSLYAALVGSLNGRRLFVKQATLDITFSFLRTCGILGGAVLGTTALAAITGFSTAATIIMTVALFYVGIGGKGEPLPLKRWLAFMAPIALYQVFINLMLQVDLAVLKRTVASLYLTAGQSAEFAADLASRDVAVYRGAQTFAFVPYQLILALAFVIFPTISRATAAGDDEATRRAIRGGTRFAAIALASIATPIAGAAPHVLKLAYPDAFQAGAGALSVLVLGMALFAFFVIGATILSGAGRPGTAAIIAGISVVVVISAVYLLLKQSGIESAQSERLWLTAVGTSMGTTLACVITALVVRTIFGAFMPLMTFVRVVIAGGVGFFVASIVPGGALTDISVAMRLQGLLPLASGFFAYLGVLVVTRELGRADLDMVLGIIGRKKSAA